MTDSVSSEKIPLVAEYAAADHAPHARAWRCAACGGGHVQTERWVDCNTGEVLDETSGDEYFCPDCEQAGDEPNRRSLCEVDDEGKCWMHDRPFAECRAG